MATLVGAVAVVTGGATGIGRALALEAAGRGARVMVADVEDCSATLAAIDSLGGIARTVHCDVGVKRDVTALREATVGEFGAVNLVCSNVGIGVGGSLLELSDEDFERTMHVNVTGSYWMLKTFAPDLIASADAGSSASMMFTGSEHSLGVPPLESPPYVPQASDYTMSKHALLGLAAVARRDLSGYGVQVSILCPGWTATERLRDFAKADDHMQMVLNEIGQEPSLVASLAFDGLARGQFIIATNPGSRDFVVATHREIIDAAEAAAAATPVASSARHVVGRP